MKEEVADPVFFEVVDDVAHVRLAHPANRNALSVEMVEGIRDAIASAEASSARVVVLRADGPAFCAGMDLREQDPDRIERALSLLVDVMRAILSSPLPFIARVHGPARAGGLGIVCAADFAVAADDVDIEFPEVRLGVAPAVVSLTVLPRLRSGDARRLLLLGQRASAAEAHAMGLIDDLAPSAKLDHAISRHVDALALTHPDGVRASKELVNAAIIADIDRRGRALVRTSSAMFRARSAASGERR